MIYLIALGLKSAIRYTIGKNRFNFSMGTRGVGGLAANIVIGTASDYYENYLAEKARQANDKFDKDDKANGINVIAQTI